MGKLNYKEIIQYEEEENVVNFSKIKTKKTAPEKIKDKKRDKSFKNYRSEK